MNTPRYCEIEARKELKKHVHRALETLWTIENNLVYEQHEGNYWLDNGFNLGAGKEKIGCIIKDLCEVKKLLKYDDVEKELNKGNR